MWPLEFNLFSALEAEAQGIKFVSPGYGLEIGAALVNDGKTAGPFQPTLQGTPSRSGVVDWNSSDPDRNEQLRRLAPPWSQRRGPDVTARNPGMTVPYPGR